MGWLLAHNSIRPTIDTRGGVNGFRRFWVPPDRGKWKLCECGRRPDLGAHYARARGVAATRSAGKGPVQSGYAVAGDRLVVVLPHLIVALLRSSERRRAPSSGARIGVWERPIWEIEEAANFQDAEKSPTATGPPPVSQSRIGISLPGSTNMRSRAAIAAAYAQLILAWSYLTSGLGLPVQRRSG